MRHLKYEQNLVAYLDIQHVIDTAVEERIVRIIQNAIRVGWDDATIAQVVEVSEEMVKRIRLERRQSNDA